MEEQTQKKQSGLKRFLRAVFIRNWDLKLGAVVMGMFLWLLGVMAF